MLVGGRVCMSTTGVAVLTATNPSHSLWQKLLLKYAITTTTLTLPYACTLSTAGLYEYYRRGIVQLAIPHSKPGSKEQGIPLWDLLAGSASGRCTGKGGSEAGVLEAAAAAAAASSRVYHSGTYWLAQR
jgi:hypothetical protein